MFQVNLTLGDWSLDGHEKTTSYTINSSLPAKVVKAAYAKGTKLLGRDFKNEVASEYADSKLPRAWIDLLLQHSVVTQEYIDELERDWESEEESSVDKELDTESYLHIYLGICHLGNPNFTWSLVNNKEIHIGGYGLFS